MNRDELERYVGMTGNSLGQVEKDYFQHIVLAMLSKKAGDRLVFKGGTALQKTGVIARFSEDLDFTLCADVSIDDLVESARRTLGAYNYPVDIDGRLDDERTISFRMKIQGPLFQNRHGFCSIRFEASRRETVALKPAVFEIAPPYSDIQPYSIRVMDLSEIAAEKVRAILTRDKPRDLYDLSKLLERGIAPKIELVDAKLEYYDRKYTTDDFIANLAHLSRGWERELEPLLRTVPEKNAVIDSVKRAALKWNGR